MYLLNIDWLETLYVLDYPEKLENPQDVYIINSNLSLNKNQDFRYYNGQYFNCFDILIDKEKIGFLYKDPIRNPLFKMKHIISIRIDNIILYEGNLHYIMKTLVDGLKLSFYGYSRLDVCIDTEEDLLSRFKDMFNDTSTYSFKHRSINGEINTLNVNGTGKYDKITTIGSLKNRKRTIVIYDKSLELEKGNKPYISKLHKEIFGHNQVFRMELRLFHKGFTKTRKDGFEKLYIDIYRLDDKGYLEEIFKQVMNEMIDFRRIEENDSNRTRWKKEEFIKLDDTSEILTKKIDRVEGQGNSYLKFMVKKLNEDGQKEENKDKKNNFENVRDWYIKEYGMNEYFIRKLSK